jgi:hypothetical protein
MLRKDLTPIDVLDRNILNLCTRNNAATYELLLMIREFDERAGWLQWGLANCAEWLAWRCDLSMTTAREKVRVAHALKSLPAIVESFASGALSYAKVRALTRVANRDNEPALLEFALRTTAANVADRCRALRCGSQQSFDTAAKAYASRALRIRRDLHRSMMTIMVELPIDSGARAWLRFRRGSESSRGRMVEGSGKIGCGDISATIPAPAGLDCRQGEIFDEHRSAPPGRFGAKQRERGPVHITGWRDSARFIVKSTRLIVKSRNDLTGWMFRVSDLRHRHGG